MSKVKTKWIEDLAVTTAKLAATSVTAAKLGSDVAGTGLGGGNGSALTVTYGTTANTACQGNDSRLFPRFQFFADQLEFPLATDWTVDDAAGEAADSNNAGFSVRLFDDTLEEGAGFILMIPTGATNIKFTFVSRAETAPASAKGVALHLYERDCPDNAVVPSWSSAHQLTALSMPANEYWQVDSQQLTLSTLGLTAGRVTQFELTRDTADAGDTLVGDWALLMIKVEFS